MESFRAKILKFVLGLTNNLNPEKVHNPIKKIKAFSKTFENDKVPMGFELQKYETENGTKYQIVHKKGVLKTEKVVLYFHGGAYISGLISYYRTLAKDFYKSCNVDLILLDYKTAP
jgi:acetyl esterase/lipase